MATAAGNGTTVKEERSSPVEKIKGSSSGGQGSSKVQANNKDILIREHHTINVCMHLLFCSQYGRIIASNSPLLVIPKQFLVSSLVLMDSGLPALQQTKL